MGEDILGGPSDIFDAGGGINTAISYGTLAARPVAGNVADGTVFYANDKNTFYQVQSGAWIVIKLTLFNIKDYGAVGDGVADDRAAVQNALNALVGAGGGILYCPAGTYLLNSTGAISIPRTSANGQADYAAYKGLIIRGSGMGSTIFKLPATNTVRGAFDLTRTADYDKHQGIFASDFTVDANSFVPNVNRHLVLGNVVSGDNTLYGNYQDIHVWNTRTVNVSPALGGVGGKSFGVQLQSRHANDAEGTFTYVKDCSVTNCDFQGCNSGAAFGGRKQGASNGVSVIVDRIVIRSMRCDVGNGTAPIAFNGDACVQIGGVGQGGSAYVADCYFANAGDVGIEVDAMTSLVVERCRGVDNWNGSFFVRNFHSAIDPTVQVAVFRDCVAETTSNINPTSSNPVGAAPGYLLGHNSAPSPDYGHIILEDCRYIAKYSNFVVTGSAIVSDMANVKRITIRDFRAAHTSISYSPGSNVFPNLVNLRPNPATGHAIVDIDGMVLRVDGSKPGGAGSIIARLCAISGASATTGCVFDINRVEPIVNYSAGVVNATTTISIGLLGSPAAMRGSIHGYRVREWSGSETGPTHVTINGTATLTIDGRINLYDNDFTCPTGFNASGNDISFPGTSNRAGVLSNNNKFRFSSSLASAATLSPIGGPLVTVTGTADITTISAMAPGSILTLLFTGTAATTGLTKGNNIKIDANFAYTPDDTITILSDGTNWYEVSRSVN